MNSNAPSAEKLARVFSRFVNSKPIVRSECMRIDAYHVAVR